MLETAWINITNLKIKTGDTSPYNIKQKTMKEKIIIFVCIILSCAKVFSQDMPRVMPASPNASALAQYASLPVSNYTGTVNTSIPLYEIKSGEISLPISISYHGSGIRVAQEASSVGLGWVLNAGGVITRSVNGLDDLKPMGGYTVVNDLPSTNSDEIVSDTYITQYYNDYKEINNGVRDGKPDILYYNFGGESGKMIFEKRQPNNTKIKGIPLKQTNSTFVYDTATNEWEVTNGNGWKYYFTVKEFSRAYSASDDMDAPSYLLDDMQRSETFDRLDPSINYQEYISAWYITKIITPKDDTITFEYDENEGHKSISQLSFYEQESFSSNNLSPVQGSWVGTFAERKTNVSVSMTSSDNINLKKIKFKNGYINFSTSDREDQRPFNNFGSFSPKPQKVNIFEIFNLSGKSIKRVAFDYSYFNENYSGKNKENYWRLKLNSVQESFYNEISGLYKANPPYTFTYDGTPLPDKTSASTDHWGYYNGYDNDHLVYYEDVTKYLSPQGPILEQYPNLPQYNKTYQSFLPYQIDCGPTSFFTTFPFLKGAIRESNPIYMQAAVLTKIKYPTGGATKFTYEPNKYNPNGDEDSYTYEKYTSSIYHDGDSVTDEIQTFYLDTYTIVNIDCQITNPGQSSLSGIKALIQDSNGHEIIRFSPNSSFARNVQLILPPGDYTLKANTFAPAQSITIHMLVSFLQRSYTDGILGSGLRILKQQNLDTNDNVTSAKSYDYTYNNSLYTSGVPMSNIKHFYKDGGDRIYVDVGLGNIPNQYNNVVVRSSENNTPLSSSAQGNFVGYSQVSVSDVDQMGNKLGTTVFTYSNHPDEEGSYHLPGMPTITHMDNGNLIKEEYFNANNILLKSISNTYVKNEPSTNLFKGVYTKYSLTTNPIWPNVPAMFVSFYRIYSEWWYLQKTTATNYDLLGNNPLVKTTVFNYDNPLHKNLTKSTLTDTTGKVIVTENKYAQDLLSGIDETSGNIVTGMISQNNINPILKSEITIDGKLVSGTINNIKGKNYIGQNNIAQTMYLPKNVKSLKAGSTGDYEERISFVDYGKYGNLSEINLTNGTRTVYIWGYGEEYPVAKIDNSTLASVEATLTDTELNNIKIGLYSQSDMITVLNKIRAALPNAQVTTYTYDPLIGVTSITQPSGVRQSFTYDIASRLKEETIRIKNSNGTYIDKKVSDNNYNYKP